MKKFLILAICFIPFIGFSQQHDVNINNLTEQTQRLTEADDKLGMVWWIPIEYWKAVFEQDPTLSERDKKDIYKTLDGYSIFAIVDGEIGTFGSVKYKSREEIFDSLTVEVSENIYKPLAENKVNKDLLTLLDLIKPILKNMLGDMGNNCHFFVFNSTDKKGKRRFDPMSSHNIIVHLPGESFEIRLPIGALMPDKLCPVDLEALNGSWNYCPYHGKQLEAK